MNVRRSIASFLDRFPDLRRVLRRIRNILVPGFGVSSNFVSLQRSEIYGESQRLRGSWLDEALPGRQRSVVDQQLRQYRAGAPIDVFDVFVESVRSLPDLEAGASLLEIGCSSGFYSEVVLLSGLQVIYSGCDYSAPFIRLAREKYPEVEFSVQDATSLSYQTSSFDIVVSGCCLQHIPDFANAVAETARVARRYAIFHRTPVVWGQPEQWYRKHAYGVETVEVHFNELDFLALLEHHGLEIVDVYTITEQSTDPTGTQGNANRTYVCRKRNK